MQSMHEGSDTFIKQFPFAKKKDSIPSGRFHSDNNLVIIYGLQDLKKQIQQKRAMNQSQNQSLVASPRAKNAQYQITEQHFIDSILPRISSKTSIGSIQESFQPVVTRKRESMVNNMVEQQNFIQQPIQSSKSIPIKINDKSSSQITTSRDLSQIRALKTKQISHEIEANLFPLNDEHYQAEGRNIKSSMKDSVQDYRVSDSDEIESEEPIQTNSKFSQAIVDKPMKKSNLQKQGFIISNEKPVITVKASQIRKFSDNTNATTSGSLKQNILGHNIDEGILKANGPNFLSFQDNSQTSGPTTVNQKSLANRSIKTKHKSMGGQQIQEPLSAQNIKTHGISKKHQSSLILIQDPLVSFRKPSKRNESKFDQLMKFDWQAQFDQLSDGLKHVKRKQRFVKELIQKPQEACVKHVKFQLPSIQSSRRNSIKFEGGEDEIIVEDQEHRLSN
eukprot:403337430